MTRVALPLVALAVGFLAGVAVCVHREPRCQPHGVPAHSFTEYRRRVYRDSRDSVGRVRVERFRDSVATPQ